MMNLDTTQLAAAVAVLRALPDADAVADFLAERGFQGYAGNACNCPVSRFLLASAPGPEGALISTYTTAFYMVPEVGTTWLEDASEPVCLPGVVVDFIEAFDTGGYPGLDLDADPEDVVG